MSGTETSTEIPEAHWKQLDIAYNLMDRMDRRIDTYISILSIGMGFFTLSDVFLIEKFFDSNLPIRAQYTVGILMLGQSAFILSMLLSLACCIFVIRPYRINLKVEDGIPTFSADTDFSISESLAIGSDRILNLVRTWEAVKNTKYSLLITVGNIIYGGIFSILLSVILSAYAWNAARNYPDLAYFYSYAVFFVAAALLLFLTMWLAGKRLSAWFYNRVNRKLEKSLI